MGTHRLLSPEQSVLLIVDVQEKFVPVVHESGRLIKNTARLMQAANLLDVPVVISEQYPKGLGHTAAALKPYITPKTAILEKMAFGCGDDEGLSSHLNSLNRRQVMVCGLEAHVCLSQTVHQLLNEGYEVHVIEDAITSRAPESIGIAIAKMRQSGAIPSNVEMALFELMRTAKHPAFKEIQALIK